MDPTARWTRLRGRHLSILSALVARQIEAQGGEVAVAALREAREVLGSVTSEEMAALSELQDAELLRRWTVRPEEDREGPG